MKGDFDELCEPPFQRKGCRKTRLARRCSFESISALSLAHIPEKHPWRWVESSGGLIYLPEWLAMSWSLPGSDKGKANQLSRSEGLCLSCSLLGLEYFKANSCCGGFSVVFFKVLAITVKIYVTLLLKFCQSHPGTAALSIPHSTPGFTFISTWEI